MLFVDGINYESDGELMGWLFDVDLHHFVFFVCCPWRCGCEEYGC